MSRFQLQRHTILIERLPNLESHDLTDRYPFAPANHVTNFCLLGPFHWFLEPDH